MCVWINHILIAKGRTETHNVWFILCAFPDLLMNQTFPLAYVLNLAVCPKKPWEAISKNSPSIPIFNIYLCPNPLSLACLHTHACSSSIIALPFQHSICCATNVWPCMNQRWWKIFESAGGAQWLLPSCLYGDLNVGGQTSLFFLQIIKELVWKPSYNSSYNPVDQLLCVGGCNNSWEPGIRCRCMHNPACSKKYSHCM